jgi:hypothetical protein
VASINMYAVIEGLTALGRAGHWYRAQKRAQSRYFSRQCTSMMEVSSSQFGQANLYKVITLCLTETYAIRLYTQYSYDTVYRL